MRVLRAAVALGLLVSFTRPALAADQLQPVSTRDVKVGGEIGRRIGVTVQNNVFQLDLEIILTEFPDPGCEATFFHIPNPNAKGLVEDELMKGTRDIGSVIR